MKNLYILGAGGFGHVIKDMAEQCGKYTKICFLDDNSNEAVGKLSDLPKFINTDSCFFVGLGNNSVRLELINKLLCLNCEVVSLIHPTAYVSPTVKLGIGCCVLPMAVVNTDSIIKDGCIINCGAVVDHNCIVNEGVHVCMNAVVKANNEIVSLTKIEACCVVERG